MAMTNTFIRDFFSYKRPHGSETEQQWIERFILPRLGDAWWQDSVGNIHYDNRQSDKHRTLFVAHVDTVHREAGRQKVAVGKDKIVRVVDGECLGADDGAGVLVLLALIEMGVRGYYVFTRCEERGGLGATHLATKEAQLLAQFDRAIAFDRRGTSSVITHQGWGRCCSNAFADALSDALSDDKLMFAPDDTGVYTDTAEFVSIIPECTNISVGYVREHSKDETLDLNHLNALIMQVLSVDWDALPTERDPAVEEYTERDVYGGWWGGSYNKGAVSSVKHNGYTDYNSDVYEACEMALQGEPDMLIYYMCQAVNPIDPDSLYEMVWSIPLSEATIKNCMRGVDYAIHDEDVEDVLIDMYNEAIDREIHG